MNFKNYLEQKNFSTKTVVSYLYTHRVFLNWIEDENIKPQELRYADLLAFIRHATRLGHSKHVIAHQLTIIRHYFDYLIKIGKVKNNIAKGLYIKGRTQRLPHNLLQEEILLKIYNEYPTEDLTGKRDKVMLGIIVYQGATTSELQKLLVEHVQLNEGTIYIPGGRKSDSRTIELAAPQVLELDNYIKHTRQLILSIAETESDHLFITTKGIEQLSNTSQSMMKKVRLIAPQVQSVKQIRASVIKNWIGKYNLREAQYRAGHRYVSSTERYELTSLDDLQNDLNDFHIF